MWGNSKILFGFKVAYMKENERGGVGRVSCGVLEVKLRDMDFILEGLGVVEGFRFEVRFRGNWFGYSRKRD